MLKHLSSEGLDSLLAVLRTTKYGSKDTCLKLGLSLQQYLYQNLEKIPTNTSNYRSIGLRNVPCRAMQRMINVKLLDFFDQKRTMLSLQCCGRAKRTIIDHLLSLEATVRKTQTNNEQVVSIFFDMEKAYNLTWRHHILMDIN